MKQGKIVGRTYCSRQCPGAENRTLLLVQPIDWETDAPSGDPLVAADCVGAGAGEKVFFVEAREAVMAFETVDKERGIKSGLPSVDAAVVGIIDGKSIAGRKA